MCNTETSKVISRTDPVIPIIFSPKDFAVSENLSNFAAHRRIEELKKEI